jgi:hypothetical protein
MQATWILGSFFFIFMLCAIAYVLTLKVPRPEIFRKSRAEAVASPVDGLVADNGKYRIAKSYQVVFSPRAFVDYPFGLRVVLAKPDMSQPIIRKSAERTEHRRSNVHRSVQASEYTGWPQLALQDPELTVIGGHFDFESGEAEPGIRVEVKPPGETFQAIKTVEEQALRQAEETVFSLWLHPIEPKISTLAVVISLVEGSAETTTPGRSGRNFHELAAVSLTVPVIFFPIALR